MTAVIDASWTQRRGRHRDKALAAYRRGRAVKLRAGGASYDSIAKEVGWASASSAQRAVMAALAEHEAEDVDVLRQVEVDRLNRIMAAAWPAAMEGSIPAARVVLATVDARIKVLGLVDTQASSRTSKRESSCASPRTVVMRPDDCNVQDCSTHRRGEQ